MSDEFDPGAFCLELLLTGGPGQYQSWEILRSPADLAAWLPDSRLALVAPLDPEDFRIRPAELRDLKRFRDTLWNAARRVAAGRRPLGRDLDVINESVGPPPRIELDPGSCTRQWSLPITGSQILAASARDAIDVLGGEGLGRVRECEAEDCSLLFVDTSRPGNRRWCSMRSCGNRNKVQAYRERKE